MISIVFFRWCQSISNAYTGVDSYITEVIKQLKQSDDIELIEIVLKSNKEQGAYTKQGNNSSFHIPPPNTKDFNHNTYFKRCAQLVSGFLSNKGQIVYHINYLTDIRLAKEFKSIIDGKILLTLHYFPDFLALPKQEVTTLGTEDFKETVFGADRIVCVTKFAQDALSKYYPEVAGKCTTIYNGIDTKVPPLIDGKNKLKISLGFRAEEKIILYAGRIDLNKGVFDLCRVFSTLTKKENNIRLIIVGGGNFQDLHNSVKDCMGQVTIAGHLNREELSQLYQIADIGIIPSRFEQCSYVALEMMKYSLAIIYSDIPGLSELFNDGENAVACKMKPNENGFSYPIDEEALSKIILSLLSEPKKVEQMGKNANSSLKEQFTITITAGRIIEEYNKSCKQKDKADSAVCPMINNN